MEDFQENQPPLSSSLSSPNPNPNLNPNPNSDPNPLLIDAELWLMAEHRTQEILCTVQPNIMCDRRRKEVINYLRTLIIGYFGTEVRCFLLLFPSTPFLHMNYNYIFLPVRFRCIHFFCLRSQENIFNGRFWWIYVFETCIFCLVWLVL